MPCNEVCVMAAHYTDPKYWKARGFSLALGQENTAQTSLALSVRSYLPLAAGPGDSAAFDHPTPAQDPLQPLPHASASSAASLGVTSCWLQCFSRECKEAQLLGRTYSRKELERPRAKAPRSMTSSE